MKTLKPNECEVRKSSAGDSLEIIFSEDGGESVTISLLQGQAGALYAQIQRQITPGSTVPIDRDSFRPGQTFAVRSLQIAKHSSGARRLVLHVELPEQGRHVTIPLDLSSEDVSSLISELKAI